MVSANTYKEHNQKFDDAPRTFAAISALLMGNVQGSVEFISLSMLRTIVADRWTSVPMPDNVVIFINAIAAVEKKQVKSNPEFKIGDRLVEDLLPDQTDLQIVEPPTRNAAHQAAQDPLVDIEDPLEQEHADGAEFRGEASDNQHIEVRLADEFEVDDHSLVDQSQMAAPSSEVEGEVQAEQVLQPTTQQQPVPNVAQEQAGDMILRRSSRVAQKATTAPGSHRYNQEDWVLFAKRATCLQMSVKKALQTNAPSAWKP